MTNENTKKNFKSLNNIVKNILIKDEYLKNKINVFKRFCSTHTVVDQKFIKEINLKNELDEKYYFVSNDYLSTNNKKFCEDITNKQLKILKLIICIKQIYDIENNGKNSFGNLIFNQIIIKNNKLILKSCKSKQKKWWWLIEEDYNIFLIPGIEYFINEILTEKESKIFISQLKAIFKSTDNYTKLEKYICKDDIINQSTYEKLYKTVFYCKERQINKYKGGMKEDLLIKVNNNNPILSNNMCQKKEQYEVEYYLQFQQLVNTAKNNYIKNIETVKNLLILLTTQEELLKDITSKKFDNIEQKIKRTIILYFIQSLMDYKNILNIIRLYT